MAKASDKSERVATGLRLRRPVHEVAEYAAQMEGRSLNNFIGRALERDPAYRKAEKELRGSGKQVYGTNQDQTNNKHEGSPEQG